MGAPFHTTNFRKPSVEEHEFRCFLFEIAFAVAGKVEEPFLLRIDKHTVGILHLGGIAAAPLFIEHGAADLVHSDAVSVRHNKSVEYVTVVPEPHESLLGRLENAA